MLEYPRVSIVVCALIAALGGASMAKASSHREAPRISQDPTADNTDVYFFRDPIDPSLVSIVANYVPLQQPAGGPNFARFADEVRYEIHVDNDGDVADDVVFRFRFKTRIVNGGTFLYNTGPITSLGDSTANVQQTYRLTRRDLEPSGKKKTRLALDAPTPPVNVGKRSTPDYEAELAFPAIVTLPGGGRVFAGQRKDPFFVDLGSIFDLLGLRPLNGAHVIPMAAKAGVDGLDGANVHTIALQLPIASLLEAGANPACVTSAVTLDDPSCVLGIYASASRRLVRQHDPGQSGVISDQGPFVQVSRLGFPLVNETLIPLAEKDRWNARRPENDLDADGFGAFIVDPEPARLIPLLYPGVSVPAAPRADVVAILRGALAGLSEPNLLPPADLLRLNVSTPVAPSASPLGLLAGDAQGFPNGRRLGDDVVDIILRVLAGGTPLTPAFNQSPNNALTDGVAFDAEQPLLARFPYVATPISGYAQAPTNP